MSPVGEEISTARSELHSGLVFHQKVSTVKTGLCKAKISRIKTPLGCVNQSRWRRRKSFHETFNIDYFNDT